MFYILYTETDIPAQC